jgi:hypothetical protein
MPMPPFLEELRSKVGDSFLVLPEEAGLVVEPVRLLGVYGGRRCRVVYPNGGTTCYVAAVYECRVVSGTPVPDGEESLEVGSFATDELAALDLSPIGRTIVRLVFGELGPFEIATEGAAT